MKTKTVGSQLRNMQTYLMYLGQCKGLAENVFLYEGLPESIDVSYMNRMLVERGRIAIFKDEVLGLLALPFNLVRKKDVYGNPAEIVVNNPTGTYHRCLKQGEFIILYDNLSRIPLIPSIYAYAERLAKCQRTIDINIGQQKTNRIWKTKKDYELSVKSLLNEVDAFDENVITYESLDLDDTTAILSTAPYVADKVEDSKEKIWNEFLRLIGVANMSHTKKERQITDEIFTMQGGTIASRFNRFESRKDAFKKIKEKFDVEVTVSYYDGLPTNLRMPDYEEIESDGDDYVSLDDISNISDTNS